VYSFSWCWGFPRWWFSYAWERLQAQLRLLRWAIRRPFHRCAACPRGLVQPWAAAADTAGGVYVTAPADDWVLKLPAGSSTWVAGEVVAPFNDCPGT
jgi:hypothetical protein